MAKRGNSPKRSRRGRRSPKKSKQGVQKKIGKNESEPVHLHEPKEVEEPDCECDLENDAEEPQMLPKMAEEAPVADAETVKADLVQFFWDSFEEDAQATLKSLSQSEEQFFLFGKVGAELAKSGKFTPEVENNLAMVWKADEAWVRSLLAGEVELPKPEPEEPEAPMEQVEEIVEAETAAATETADIEVEGPKDEAEVAAEVAAEAEAPVPDAPVPEVAADLSEVMEPKPAEVVEEKFQVFEDAAMQGVVQEPESIQEFVSESAIIKENTTHNMIQEAVSAKLGEQSIDSAVESLAPENLNMVQPLDLA